MNIVITCVNPKGNSLFPFMHLHLKKLKKKSHDLFDKPVSGLKACLSGSTSGNVFSLRDVWHVLGFVLGALGPE